MKFTDKFIKGLPAKGSDYRVYEKGADKGFGVKVTRKGHKSFFQQYSHKGRVRFLALGHYPSVSLEKARLLARAAKEQVEAGQDPQSSHTPEERKGTVEQLISHYVCKLQEQGSRSWPAVDRALRNNISGSLLELQAADITSQHIRQILYEVIRRGASVQANRLRSYLQTAFKYGIYHDNDPKSVSTGLVFGLTSNPVSNVPKDTSVEQVGNRVLTTEELSFVLNYSGTALSVTNHLALCLILAMGGQRPNEIVGAYKSELDLEKQVWSIPPERIKNKRWHLLPITQLANYYLAQAIQYSSNSACLFPNLKDKNKPQHETSLTHAVRRFCLATNIDPFTPRDLRRTVKTKMGELGISKEWRDRVQNHALTDVSTRHYDRWDYLPEKRAALEMWEGWLVTLS